MKLKKLAAVFMAVTLAAASLTACGSDDDEATNKKAGSFKESIEEGLKLSEEKLTFNGKLQLGYDITDDESENLFGMDKLNVAITFSGKKDGNNTETKVGVTVGNTLNADFIELVTVDNVMYLNIEALVNGIADIMNTTGNEISAEDISSMLPDGKYLKVTKYMLEQLMSLSGTGMDLGYSGLTSSISEEDVKEMKELGEYIFELLDKGIKKGEKSAYSSDGDTYKLTINNENINGIVSGIADVVSSKSDEIVKKLGGSMLEDLESEGSMTLDADTIKSVAELLKSYDVASMLDVDFEVAVYTECQEDTWNFGLSAGISGDSDKYDMTMEYGIRKDDSVTVTAPTDLISDEDAQNLINTIVNLGALDDLDDLNGLDYDWSLDDLDEESPYDTIDEITTDNTEAVSTKGVSGKFSDAQVYYNGTVLSIGKSTIGDMLATGYELGDDETSENDIVVSGEAVYYYNSDLDITIRAYNYTNKDVKVKDATLCDLDVNTIYTDEEKLPEMYIMGDITFGSKVEDLFEVMGQPTEAMSVGDMDYVNYCYEKDDMCYIYNFIVEDGAVIGIEVDVY